MHRLAPRLAQLRVSWLDFKLGFRMLGRYPGLTLVGTLAIAVAIALGTLYFEAINKWQNPRLPVRDAERVVSIRNWDLDAFTTEARSLHDFAIWREQVKTIDHLGAAIVVMRNLATEDGQVEPVPGAEISASAFRLTGTAPLLGRALTEDDERIAAPPVVLLGYALWKSRFAGDPGVLGRTVKLGSTDATIVGVMPEGFGFPVNQRIWTPLRVDASALAPRSGPAVSIFGRLAPGATMDEARAELGVIGARMAATSPQTHEHLRPRVTTYAQPLAEGGTARLITRILYVVNAVFLLLLAIVCTNVATLVFARTATRGWEITVRTALGASRGRIIAQLFIEALVLTSLAAVVGLAIARVSMHYGLSMMIGSEALPYWIDASLSWTHDALRRIARAGRRRDRGRASGAARHEDQRAGRAAERERRSVGAPLRRILDHGDRGADRDHRRVPAARRRRRIRVEPVPATCGGHRRGALPHRQHRHGPRELFDSTRQPSPRARASASTNWNDGSKRSRVWSASPSPTGCR